MPIAGSGAISIGNAAGSDRSINEELDRTHNTANSSMTTLVTAAVTGSTPRGSGSVTDARPHAFSEWHSYQHTQDFGTPTYYARNSTSTDNNTLIAAYANLQTCSATANEALANSISIFYAILNGTTVEFYMLPDASALSVSFPSESAHWKNTSGTTQNYSGNFSSGFTAVKIAELDTGSVSGRQVSITTAVLTGTGSYIEPSGYTNVGNGTFFTPSSTKHSRAPHARAFAACFGSDYNVVAFSVIFKVKATGYNTKTLNTFVTSQSSTAISNNCL